MHALSTLAAAAVLGAAAVAPAQHGARLIGLTNTTPAIVTQDPASCAVDLCRPAGLGAVQARYAGGTAWDATRRGVWISDGKTVALVDARHGCAFLCRPQPLPQLAAADFVTALAFDEVDRTLWVADSNNVLRVYATDACALTLVRRCQPAVPQGHVISGLATDEVRKLVFFASSPWLAPTLLPGGIVWVAGKHDPCTPRCKLEVRTCGNTALRLITGLAHDPCRQILWVTEGNQTVGGHVDVAACTFREVQCCRLPVNESLVGLCLIPPAERSDGQSCQNGSCPSCPQMRHVLRGDPTLANPHFALDLVGAPERSMAYLVFNEGPCGPGLLVRPFCGAIMVPFRPLPPIVVGPFRVPGTTFGGCSGKVSAAVPVPADPSLCGVVFASQFIGLCGNGLPIGTYVSNCLSYTVTGT